MSLMSPLREHKSTFAEERGLIEEVQEEDHFQKKSGTNFHAKVGTKIEANTNN
jgi:hypothetical protein